MKDKSISIGEDVVIAMEELKEIKKRNLTRLAGLRAGYFNQKPDNTKQNCYPLIQDIQ
jgi:hypothetical protein